MKIALYGGSFNPPHLGHRAAAVTVSEMLRPDRLVIMPDNLPPHKELPEDSPAGSDRLHLCEMNFAGIPDLEVSDRELRRECVSYTADTVERLRAERPDDEFFLVIGTDMLLCFEHWYRFHYLLEQCVLTVLCRLDEEREQLEEKAAQLRADFGAKVLVLPHEPIETSSAEIRELLPRRLGRDELDEQVYAEIIRHRWYGAQPELSWLREKAYAMLKPKRIAHVAGCEGEAVALAMRWGEDPELAAEAAILHDVTKRMDKQEQFRFCEERGIELDPSERESPRVLHAITAAAYAEEQYGVNEAVKSAIRWHCTGRPDMTLLEKIVWLADFIEPTRDFPGIDEVRSLAFEDLDRALRMALDMTLQFIEEKGAIPCDITEKALQYYMQSDRR